MTFNEDIKINGVLAAAMLDGKLSPSLEAAVADCMNDAIAPLSQELKMWTERIDTQMRAINELQNQNLEITKRLDNLTSKYNQAIEVINNLSARIDALEANYDPTLIK